MVVNASRPGGGGTGGGGGGGGGAGGGGGGGGGGPAVPRGMVSPPDPTCAPRPSADTRTEL